MTALRLVRGLLALLVLAGSASLAAQTRIVSLAPALTESLFDIGAGGAVVGTMEFSDRPPEARAIARIGSHAGLDLERIVALRPTIVLAWGGGTPALWIERLRALALPVEVISVGTLDDIASALVTLGRLSGHRAQADRLAAEVRSRLARLGRLGPRWRAFYQVWPEPLMTLNGEHVISDAMARCGARNVFAALPALVPHVGAEDVLRARPQAIIAARAAGDDADPLAFWRRFTDLPAVREDRLIVLDADRMARPTVAMLDEVERLCARLER
ncbi:MAG: cobalamin-binding protein [Burkholderiaceae bacterium]